MGRLDKLYPSTIGGFRTWAVFQGKLHQPMIRLLCLSWLVLLALTAAAQTHTYTIFVGDDAVGQLTATESAYVGGGTVFNLDSKMKIEFIGSFIIESHQASYFKRSVLQEAEMVISRNGKLREQCIIKRQAQGYHVSRKGENAVDITGEVTLTIGQLYHHEPKGITQVFSERLGQFCTVRAISVGNYEVILPNGSKNRYMYQQGICQRMETTSNLKDVRFERRR